MSMNQPGGANRLQALTNSMHEHWVMFLVEGIVLLGLVIPLKILVPAWTLIGIVAGTALIGSDRNKVAWAEMIKLVPGTVEGLLWSS